jgi:hypothetical protein
MIITSLKPRHIKALEQAIDEANGWRGSLMGHDSTEATMNDEDQRLAEFDARISRMLKALEAVKKMNAAVKALSAQQKGLP